MYFYDVLIIPLPTPQAGIFGITDEFTLDKNILLNNSKEFDNNILLIFAYSREKHMLNRNTLLNNIAKVKKQKKIAKVIMRRKSQLVIENAR